jgi:2-oxoglutarate ferredoxin oxidoreductase subunit gamma
MNKRFEMRFSGSGGQGIVLISIILAEAAILSDLQAVQSQTYGPEARGGLCKAETIISGEAIWFSKVVCPDFLLALTQASLEQYIGNVARDAAVMIDESLTLPGNADPKSVLALPILKTAKERVGSEMTANIVAVGAINAALRLFPEDALSEAVKRHIPAGTEILNLKALEEGKKLISSEAATQFRLNFA